MRTTTYRLLTLTVAAALIVGFGACASTQSASTQIDDATITSKVKTKLSADPEVNPFNIDVDTDDGIVRLSGKVEKERARDEAQRLAVATRGVRGVINNISIGHTTLGQRAGNTGLAAKVKAKIAADPELNPFNIDVDGDDGTITLSGRVATDTARAEAEELARNTQGVRDVRNLLEVGKGMSR